MILWIVAAIAAFFVKGLCGFANTLVFTAILGFGVNNVNISPVDLVIGFPANLYMAWKNRKHLKVRIYLPLASLVIAGTIPGAFLLKNVNAQAIKLVFGIAVVLIGLEMLFRDESKAASKQSKIVLAIIGLLSGLLVGLFGVGALLAAYVGRVTENTDEFKGNISAVFLAENTLRLFLYSYLGVINLESLKQSIMIIPFVLIGLLAGSKSGDLLNEAVVKRIVIIVLILSGLVLIVKNLL